MAGWTAHLRHWARGVKRDVVALWIAARDPRTPTVAKVAAAVLAAYALSPIDLIPDFIPVLGYLDDLVIVPSASCLSSASCRPHLWRSSARTQRGERSGREAAPLLSSSSFYGLQARRCCCGGCRLVWCGDEDERRLSQLVNLDEDLSGVLVSAHSQIRTRRELG